MSLDNKSYKYHKIFCDLLLEAGDYAAQSQAAVKTKFKDGEQAVTETDLYVSKLAHERLASVINQKDYILLDEESIGAVGTPESVFKEYDNLIILDPIDGTAGYAMGRDFWGVILAHWHKGIPIWGGLYLPKRQTLIVNEGSSATCLTMAGTDAEKRVELSAKPIPINSQTYIETHRTNHLAADKEFLKQKAWFNTPESAIQAAYSVLQGQAAAAVISTVYSLWDMAATMALANSAGLTVLDLYNGKEKKVFTAEDITSSWKMERDLLICHPENANTLINLFAEDRKT